MTLYRCTCIGNLASGEVFNFGLHTDDSGVGDISEMLDVWSGALDVLWAGNGLTLDGIADLITDNVSAQVARVASLSPTDGKQMDAVEEANVHAGTDSTAKTLPQEVAVAVTTRGSSVNRRNRGRFFLPSLSSAQLDDAGLLLTTAATTIADNAQGMLQHLNTNAKTPVIYHRDLLTSTPIATLDVGNVFDAQRRRRNKLIETRISRTV